MCQNIGEYSSGIGGMMEILQIGEKWLKWLKWWNDGILVDMVELWWKWYDSGNIIATIEYQPNTSGSTIDGMV